MPKYYEFKVCGYYLYYTSHCVIEAMHVHASDRKFTEIKRFLRRVKLNDSAKMKPLGNFFQGPLLFR